MDIYHIRSDIYGCFSDTNGKKIDGTAYIDTDNDSFYINEYKNDSDEKTVIAECEFQMKGDNDEVIIQSAIAVFEGTNRELNDFYVPENDTQNNHWDYSVKVSFEEITLSDGYSLDDIGFEPTTTSMQEDI